MPAALCQGLQSCLESELIESRLRLKLAAQKFIEFDKGPFMLDRHTKTCHKKENNGMTSHFGDMGGRSFLQYLSNISKSSEEEMDKGSTYVHPLARTSSSPRLSERSLELCTENLGSETGTNITDNSIFSVPSEDLRDGKSAPREGKTKRQEMGPRKVKADKFPPPLTTISGPNSLQVRRHREGGRLILEAVESPSAHTYFQVERSNGRLRLWLLVKNNASDFDSEETIEEHEGGKEEDEIERFQSNSSDEEKQEDQDAEEDDEEERSEFRTYKEMDGNGFGIEAEMGMEKFQRPSRCNEGGQGNKRLYNWEPLWVASS